MFLRYRIIVRSQSVARNYRDIVVDLACLEMSENLDLLLSLIVLYFYQRGSGSVVYIRSTRVNTLRVRLDTISRRSSDVVSHP